MNKMKKLYLVERTDDVDYDEFDSFIVCARSKQEARQTTPHFTYMGQYTWGEQWIKREDINALNITYIGIANKRTKYGVILASFNAG